LAAFSVNVNQDAPWVDYRRRHRIRNPAADHPGLSRAGAGQDGHRAGDRGHGVPLLVVQIGEDEFRIQWVSDVQPSVTPLGGAGEQPI
jgi:hypothetical protein